jgi:glycyl-tRNA synthetase
MVLLLLAMPQVELTAYEKFPEPREVEVTRVVPNKQALGMAFKKEAKAVVEALEALGEEDVLCLKVGAQ